MFTLAWRTASTIHGQIHGFRQNSLKKNTDVARCLVKTEFFSSGLWTYIYILYLYTVYIYAVYIYIYRAYIYIQCIYIYCIYTLYIYILYIYIYTQCIYIYIYTVYIYIYSVYIYIYTACIYIYIQYIYIYRIYIQWIYIYSIHTAYICIYSQAFPDHIPTSYDSPRTISTRSTWPSNSWVLWSAGPPLQMQFEAQGRLGRR